MKKHFSVKQMILAAIFAAFCAVCAQIVIPFAVPFTMQTFAVYTTLGILGARLGTVSVTLYLLLGAVGLPVFSGFSGGVSFIAGPTGGYLFGFLAICAACAIVDKKCTSTHTFIIATAVGTLVCYAVGTAWFALVFSKGGVKELGTAFTVCVLPFILPDAAKLAAATVVTARLKPILKKLL